MMDNCFKYSLLFLTALFLTGTLFTVSLRPQNASFGQLENIKGIPYPIQSDYRHIYEPLAHADLYLNQPALAKTADITVTFIPRNINNLSVGIRENSFWLSYPKHALYTGSPSQQPVTRTVSIPLTDKLQEKDQSLDLMFFAGNHDTLRPEDTVNSTINWELRDISVTTRWSKPASTEIKDWLRSIINRERAL